MGLLCYVIMRSAGGEKGNWCSLFEMHFQWIGTAVQLCSSLLMVIAGGAMISASGHMIALLCPCKLAYGMGAVATLVLAWVVGFGSLRPLSWLSTVLTVLLLAAISIALVFVPQTDAVYAEKTFYGWETLCAAARAIAYASMNLTLAIGIVCRCADKAGSAAKSVVFGTIMTLLLLVSNMLYIRHPEVLHTSFPLVHLLSYFGRNGFFISVVLLYLSIFTTLTALLSALREAAEQWIRTPFLQTVLAAGLPLTVSSIGFSGIVDGLYAPAGAVCLMMVFVPLLLRKSGA